MKVTSGLIAVVLAGSLALPAMGYVPPNDDLIAGVLADHTQMNEMLTDANPDQIAEVVGQALSQVGATTLATSDKNQTAALLYTRALLLSGEKAPQMAGKLMAKIDPALIPVLAASTAIAVGSAVGPVFDAMAAAAGTQGSKALLDAAADPASVLDEESISLVQQLVIELRGVAAPVIPPPATSPMNLVPPIVPKNVTTPGTPPVGTTYGNQ